jgi:hypothetical protein
MVRRARKACLDPAGLIYDSAMRRGWLALGIAAFSQLGVSLENGCLDRLCGRYVSRDDPGRRAVRTTFGPFNYGSRHLAADLYWPRGVLLAGRLPNGGSYATLNSDGSISAKIGWWRGMPGTLRLPAAN